MSEDALSNAHMQYQTEVPLIPGVEARHQTVPMDAAECRAVFSCREQFATPTLPKENALRSSTKSLYSAQPFLILMAVRQK